MNHTFRLGAATMLAMLLGSYLYTTSASAAEVRDISKVNGGIRISANEQVGNISSVNGGIDLGRGSSAYNIDTVNGGIDLDEGVVISDAETVNGGIRVGDDVTVNGSLITVNGGIRMGSGTVVRNRVRTVNGKIQLRNTLVREDVQTTNGDILLRDGSSVEGDIIIRGKLSWLSRIFRFNHKPPTIYIDSDSSVRGDIHLYRKANLEIDDGAEVGEIVYHY
ncbi:MAG: hypothetical protein COA96_07485 [SAR86 cluster bacterium]|uniref:Polymer-forming cytoskeletal protein n=1 Tax=SAR86 cluster bacterium TaxID=2030880 RepID=A0A2A5B2I6_9GAMM|nr:MAG: hypothetical protein COA96_07485 [SAR86 cluster bacterium]